MHRSVRVEVLLATTSEKKLVELKAIFAGLPLVLLTPGDLGLDLDVEETGDTFAANARLKAEAFAAVSGRIALADDSGLEIDALQGEPGVRSRRYAGPTAGDAERMALVLEKLRDVPEAERTARFRCVMAVAVPVVSPPAGRDEALLPAAPPMPREHVGVELIGTVEGVCEGLIAAAPRGHNGFGYDPIFLLPERGRTMAELTAEEKQSISHRGRAGVVARRLLDTWLLEAAPARR